MTRVLLLGGGGFLGSKLYLKLKNAGYNVVIADLYLNSSPKTDFIELNILSSDNLIGIFSDFEIIINLTGQITDPINSCLQLNSWGMSNILNALKGTNNYLVQISTVSVYGTSEHVDEESILNPETPYAVCKAISEFQIQQSLQPENYSILRLSNLFGPGQSKGLFAYLTRAAYSDRNLTFNNDGSLLRYYLHIDDCVKAIELALRFRISGIYNVSGQKSYTISEIIEYFNKFHNINYSIKFSETMPSENIQTVSMDKFRQKTGFVPKQTVEDYIKELFINGY